MAVLTYVASGKFTDTLILKTQHPYFAPCIPLHHRGPINAAWDTEAQSQDLDTVNCSVTMSTLSVSSSYMS